MIKMAFKEYKEACPDEYSSPEISGMDIQAEGVLCESNEPLDDYLGDW